MPINTKYHCQCPGGHPQAESVMTNDAAGNTVCADCGTVLEQDEIVAEVTFLEGSNGGHTALGGRVTADSVGRHALPGMGRSSGRNPTYDARQLITQYAHSLAVANDSVIESAHRLYTLAYIQKLTLGKRKTLVCAACLYIALRKERQAVMLIELAELVGVSVFKLGTVFMQLRREFPSVANVDDIDPSVYISRFAQALEFGNKTRDVANDAMLLVKRMQLDWIADGRRPAGICGACLLIAARMHHFHRTVKEIVHVVKMSDSTVIQRLREFSRTPAAQLSAKEFREKAADKEAVAASLPPSYLKHRVKEVLQMSVKGELPEGVSVESLPKALVKKVKREMNIRDDVESPSKAAQDATEDADADADAEAEAAADDEEAEDEQAEEPTTPVKLKSKGKAKAKAKPAAAADAAVVGGRARRGHPPKPASGAHHPSDASKSDDDDEDDEPAHPNRGRARVAASQLQVLSPEPTQRIRRRSSASAAVAAASANHGSDEEDAMQLDASGSDDDAKTPVPQPLKRTRKRKAAAAAGDVGETKAEEDDDDDDEESQSAEIQGLKSEIVELAQLLLTQSTPSTSRPSSAMSTPAGSPARPSASGISPHVRKRARTYGASAAAVALNERDLVAALQLAMPKNPATSGTYAELDKSTPGADIEPPAATAQLKDIVPMSKLLKTRLAPPLPPKAELLASGAGRSSDATELDEAGPAHRGMTPLQVAGGYAPLARDPSLGVIPLTDADRNLSDLDSDPEVTSALITDAAAVRVREQLWVHQNRDWMAAQAEIQRKRAEAAKNGEEGKRKRGGRKRKAAGAADGADAGPPRDVVDAVHRLVRKKVSAKVNRESVADLFGPLVGAGGAGGAAGGGEEEDGGEAEFMVEDEWGGGEGGQGAAGEYYGHDEYGAGTGGSAGSGAPGGFPNIGMLGSMYGATDDHGFEEY